MAADDLDTVAADAARLEQQIASFAPIVERFLKTSGSLPTHFGRDIGYGPDFIRFMRAGRSFTAETMVRALRHVQAKALAA